MQEMLDSLAVDPSTATPRRTRRGVFAPALSRRIAAAAVILLGVLHFSNLLVGLYFYRTTATREYEALAEQAALFAEHASRAIGAIDLSLEIIADDLAPSGRPAPPDEVIQKRIEDRARQLADVATVIVLDASGRSLFDSRGGRNTHQDYATADFFTGPQATHGPNLYIAPSREIAPGGGEVFAIGRAIYGDGGGLRAVAVALVDATYFSAYYRSSVYGQRDHIALYRDGGGVLASSGSPETGGGADAAAVDGRAPMVVRRIPTYPLHLVAIGPRPVASSAYQDFLITDALAMLAATILTLSFTYFVAREATAREKAETRLRDAIEHAPAGFALFDGEDRLILCNEKYRELYPLPARKFVVPGVRYIDMSRKAVRFNPYLDLSDPAVLEAHLARWYDIHRSADTESIHRLSSGGWILNRGRRTEDGGLVAFHTDITLMKQQEEALRRSEQAERTAREQAETADRAKSAFLATMSHELRTPLNAIIGFSEIIESELFGRNNPRYPEYGGLIRRSGQHLLAIINDILDIAKLQSGKTELHAEPTDLGELSAGSIQLVMEQVHAAKLTLTSAVPDDLPLVMVDPVRLRQILLNLLSNAIKFTPEGGTIAFSVGHGDDGICIEVADTGIGMKPADIPTALEPFGQVSNAMTREHEGTGLGLPLTRSLVELHGGRLDIASVYGHGTTVRVLLPTTVIVAAEATQSIRRQTG